MPSGREPTTSSRSLEIAITLLVSVMVRGSLELLVAPTYTESPHSLACRVCAVDSVVVPVAAVLLSVEVSASAGETVDWILRRIKAEDTLDDPDGCLSLESAAINVVDGEVLNFSPGTHRAR